VAKGRELPVAQVDTIARGRVWSGKAAKELGLVDSLGGFAEAEAALAGLAGLTPGSYRVNELQPDRDLFQQLLGDMFGARQSHFARLLGQLPDTGLAGSAKVLLTELGRFDDPQHVYAYCYCTPQLGGR